MEDVAGRALRRAWLWAVVGALALGALAALVATVARARRILLVALLLGPGAFAGLAGGICLARVDATFDPSAFQRASFYRGLVGPESLPARGLAGQAAERLPAEVKDALNQGDIGVAAVASTEELSPDDPRVKEAITALSD